MGKLYGKIVYVFWLEWSCNKYRVDTNETASHELEQQHEHEVDTSTGTEGASTSTPEPLRHNQNPDTITEEEEEEEEEEEVEEDTSAPTQTQPPGSQGPAVSPPASEHQPSSSPSKPSSSQPQPPLTGFKVPDVRLDISSLINEHLYFLCSYLNAFITHRTKSQQSLLYYLTCSKGTV